MTSHALPALPCSATLQGHKQGASLPGGSAASAADPAADLVVYGRAQRIRAGLVSFWGQVSTLSIAGAQASQSRARTCTTAERTLPPAAATAESKWRDREASVVAQARFFTYSVVEGKSLASGCSAACPAVLCGSCRGTVSVLN